MEQPRKPKGSPNGTGGQYDTTRHGATPLPAMTGPDPTRPVGDRFMDDVNDIAEGLFDRRQDWDTLPVGGCYRINDWGDYVAESDWSDVWDGHPLEEKAWMLADNGEYSSDDVAHMTPAEIEATYDAGFEPEVAFYTEKYEDDHEPGDPIGDGMVENIRQVGERLATRSREDMDFRPGDRVHATPDGYVSEDEWNRAWAGRPAYCADAYELSCRHPGLDMARLSPEQIVAMNRDGNEYVQYMLSDDRAHDGVGYRHADRARREAASRYRQYERNAPYVGRDLNDVICLREAAYTGDGLPLGPDVRDAIVKLMGAPDPTGDKASLSTLALGVNHDPYGTVDAVTALVAHSPSREGDLERRLRDRLEAPSNRQARATAESMSTIMDCVAGNADDTQDAGWLADSLGVFAAYRAGDRDTAKREAEFIHRSMSERRGPLPRQALTADMIARIILDH
ncbi:hypothetical protein [Bifidobacterium castoris]|uniref:Uncharacterized protein n=1 Tax=Bifidobacterium castoris TaxID=2306972 RepID=A0A430FAA7_9BIFI|nr:hypothetical protein [Bifidobacterium castoris]RSX49771.1 hypothetical protein D2E22_0232 [Bifidobacterium castoris]